MRIGTAANKHVVHTRIRAVLQCFDELRISTAITNAAVAAGSSSDGVIDWLITCRTYRVRCTVSGNHLSAVHALHTHVRMQRTHERYATALVLYKVRRNERAHDL